MTTTRFTPLGWITLVEGAVLCLVPAWQHAPVAIAGGVGMFAALAAARVLAPRRLAAVRADWVLPRRIHAGAEVVLQARITADPGAPPLTLLAWDPRSRSERSVARLSGLAALGCGPRWTTRFPARGLVALPPLAVAGEQPMGLCLARRAAGDPAHVVVLPALGRVRAGLRTRLAEWFAGIAPAADPGGDEPARLRAWVPGDPPARVHWRASARHRELLVAERNAPAARRLAVVIDPQAGGAVFERLVSAAATVVDDLSRAGWELAVHHGHVAHGATGAADRLLETLALARPGGEPLSEVVPRGIPCLAFLADPTTAPESSPPPLVVRDGELPRLVHLPRRLARGEA